MRSMIDAAVEALKSKTFKAFDHHLFYKAVRNLAHEIDIQRHPLGFIHADLTSLAQLSVGSKLRLHIWDSKEGALDDFGNLHDHVWALHSYVLEGSILDSTYRALPDPKGDYVGSRVLYGEQNRSTSSRRYSLKLVRNREVAARKFYTIPPGVVHFTEVKETPSVTLLLAIDDVKRKATGPLVLRRAGTQGTPTSVREDLDPEILISKLDTLLLKSS